MEKKHGEVQDKELISFKGCCFDMPCLTNLQYLKVPPREI